MKQIKCELCGGTDFIKQDGLYVCQQCGAKFSPEEAMKLMSDSSEFAIPDQESQSSFDNLYSLALKAIEEKDYIGAGTYFETLEQRYPNNWRPSFYLLYCQLANCKLGEREASIEKFTNELAKVFDKVSVSEAEELRQPAFREIAAKSSELIESIVKDAEGLFPHILDKDRYQETIQHCSICITMIGDAFNIYFPNGELKEESVRYLKRGIQLFYDLTGKLGTTANVIMNGGATSLFQTQIATIKEVDPTYVSPFSFPQSNSSSSTNDSSTSSGGCYIATAVYGSYDCPEVWTLRRFRDTTLDSTWYGRLFIKFYYTTSPVLVKQFGGTRWFKELLRGPLDKMIHKLQSKGVESTPYHDKY